jgi:TPR repeat protein
MWKTKLAALACMVLGQWGLAGGCAYAQGELSTRLISFGASSDGTSEDLNGVSRLLMQNLPEPDAARTAILSTLLRSNAVSTFVAGPQDLSGNTEQLFLSLDGTVVPGTVPAADGAETTIAIEVGGDLLSLDDFGSRLSAMVDAVGPEQRQIAFFRLNDTGNQFPTHVTAFQKAVATSGFAMVVAEIGSRSATCAVGVDPLIALVAGFADREPFGDGDGRTAAVEATEWLRGALSRPGRRSGDCNTTYALVVQSDSDPYHIVALTVPGVRATALESQLYRENFEAKFLLGSANAVRIASYLDDCIHCPNERELSEELTQLRQQDVTRQLETAIWDDIRSDTLPDRMRVYIDSCQLCDHADAANDLISAMVARDVARTVEDAAFRTAADANNLTALRQYATGCIACDHKVEAERLVAQIETNKAYRAEQAALDVAQTARDRAALEAWLSTCTTCDGKSGAEAALAELIQAEKLVGPCMEAAGLPQHGGPRQLTAIDVTQARAACGAAVAALPADPRLRVVAARIDQAQGQTADVLSAYDTGVASGVPEAHGLAAYLRFSPPEGQAPDYPKAASLARDGAELGDWLSKEILMLLYSRQMVDDHTPEEAVDISRALASEGNEVGQFFLGYFLLNGLGVSSDAQQALVWLQKATDAGYVRAQPFLAEIYENGVGVVPDPDLAASLFLGALEAGDAVALTRLTDQLGERSPEVIRALQEMLRDKGSYNGRVDGLSGPGTVRAVQAYAEAMLQAAGMQP